MNEIKEAIEKFKGADEALGKLDDLLNLRNSVYSAIQEKMVEMTYDIYKFVSGECGQSEADKLLEQDGFYALIEKAEMLVKTKEAK